jgi:hypothetical protein
VNKSIILFRQHISRLQIDKMAVIAIGFTDQQTTLF